MNASHIREFRDRDWAAVERLKAEFWTQRKRALSPSAALTVSDDLRLFVQRLRPDWPTASERLEDLDTHARVSRALRLAAVGR